VNTKITVRWDVTLCSLADMYWCFGGTLASISRVEMSSTLMMEVEGVILLWISVPCLCFRLIFCMINIQGIIEFSMEFAIPFTQIYWLMYLYGIFVHDMQRAYKSHIAIYSLMFFVENHCVKKIIIIIIIILILNMDVSLLWELVWGSFSMFIKRSVMLLWHCWMLRPGYFIVFFVFLFFCEWSN